MRILFGPEHDNLHIDPNAPGGYEWWYFDAVSDDGRYALVVIYFLGSPMSPYYKASAQARGLLPRDWCGVFVTLHERTGDRWRERAYAYNLYRDGQFSRTTAEAAVGGSRLTAASEGAVYAWRLAVDEPGLWRGRTAMDLTFRSVILPAVHEVTTPPGAHTWVCVAPLCRAEGTVRLPDGQSVAFHGSGYHDHNFGHLPYDDTATWYWGRAPLVCDDGLTRAAVFYHLEAPDGALTSTLLLFGPEGVPLAAVRPDTCRLSATVHNAYGLAHATCLELAATGVRLRARLRSEGGTFSEGPFYRRLPVEIEATGDNWRGAGAGVGEFFRPAKLCGPVVTRAMWSRIRWRKKGREQQDERD